MKSLKVIKGITEKVNTHQGNVPLETDIGNQQTVGNSTQHLVQGVNALIADTRLSKYYWNHYTRWNP